AHRPVNAGDCISIGGSLVQGIASPGHTPEHLSYVIRPPSGPSLLFSGGALIVGGAARTDLIAPDQTETLTRATYRTLHTAFAALPDETLLFPTHGGGSFCSAGAGGERTSTLGHERATNPLLATEDEDVFTRWFPRTFPPAPAYFYRLRPVNQAGPRPRREIAFPPALSPTAFDAARAHALVVDVRSKEDYHAGHIPGALSNALRDGYATWLGWLVPPDTPLLFVANGVDLDRVIDESLLVGYERFAGRLEGGMAAWTAAGLPCQRSALVTAQEAAAALRAGAVSLVVRESSEYAEGHLPDAFHIPLGRLEAEFDRLPGGRPLIAYCGHGERAATAISLLERAGIAQPLLNLDGGFGAWQAAGLPDVSPP
ncbi:MAG: rhodanese-like domain-containing protein, partial [Dehalococcoidia bacterium]